MVATNSFSLPFAVTHGAGQSAPGELRLRRFGSTQADLAVDFTAPRPQLVSDLIAYCATSGDGAAVAALDAEALSLSSRIVVLLLLASMEGQRQFWPALTCPEPDCRQPIELDVSVEEALAFAPVEADSAIEVTVDGRRVRLRRPTGRDQLGWLRAGYSNETDARLGVLRSLALTRLPRSLPAGWIEAMEKALDAQDPLVCFSLEAVCPFCQALARHEVALADLALQVLRQAQTRLILGIHRLASRYGWSEADVFALPAWRRERYLALIEAGVV